jgi:hypothetical protein
VLILIVGVASLLARTSPPPGSLSDETPAEPGDTPLPGAPDVGSTAGPADALGVPAPSPDEP